MSGHGGIVERPGRLGDDVLLLLQGLLASPGHASLPVAHYSLTLRMKKLAPCPFVPSKHGRAAPDRQDVSVRHTGPTRHWMRYD